MNKRKAGVEKRAHQIPERQGVIEISLSSPIREKITWAENCFRRVGDRIKKDGKIAENIFQLRTALADSRKEMSALGLDVLCMACDRDEGGSCCGKGLENRYDGWLLLANLLLGVHLPSARRDPESCFFLGEQGCLLQARHVICINYLCRKITDRFDPGQLSSMRNMEEKELTALFHLKERVKRMVLSDAEMLVLPSRMRKDI